MAGLEDSFVSLPDQHEARASLVVGSGEVPGLTASLWMGGARSILGQLLDNRILTRSLVIDCAGDMPAAYREAAAAWIPCVFVDHDGPVAGFHRLQDAARQAAQAASHGDVDAVYAMCTHGMNRSGLVTGMIMRELGMSGAEAVGRILAARPGSLSNLWFRQLLANG
ncbi:MAG TPA: hypothetical protein VJQ83_08570 [Tepidiformaceae bacterium]|nr:hypothetical protein [Tepidiformaceae bacterium]